MLWKMRDEFIFIFIQGSILKIGRLFVDYIIKLIIELC